MAAMALDGKIATRSGDSRISSGSDLKRLHRLRAEADAVMIGVGTQLKDNPLLTVRRVRGRSPIRIIIDGLARTPANSRIFSTKDSRIIVAVSNRAPPTRVNKLKRAGAEIIQCGTQQVNLKKLLAKLHANGVNRILLEGGGKLNWSMLSNGLVDEIMVTVAPIIIGGEKATTLVEGVGAGEIDGAIKLSLKNMKRHGSELVMHYDVRNR
jgi:2,5-diamino-6-(ribosylamino)-4(3H)-pyrimidinone 5'-phosphate reductase